MRSSLTAFSRLAHRARLSSRVAGLLRQSSACVESLDSVVSSARGASVFRSSRVVYGAECVTPGFGVGLLRHYSDVAAAQLERDDSVSEHLLPRQKEKPEEVIRAFPRHGSGKIVCKKERRAGRAPSLVFGQENGHLGGDKQLLSVETKQIERLLKRYGKSFFLSRTFDLEIYDEEGNVQSKERVLPRSIHLHAGSDKLMNVTFIRAPPTALLKVDVPLVFLGEDACPGIRKGGYIYTMMRTVKYRCPGDAIPPCIEVDLSTLDIGQKILLKDLKTTPGMILVKKDSSLPVIKVMGSRASSDSSESAAAPAAPVAPAATAAT